MVRKRTTGASDTSGDTTSMMTLMKRMDDYEKVMSMQQDKITSLEQMVNQRDNALGELKNAFELHVLKSNAETEALRKRVVSLEERVAAHHTQEKAVGRLMGDLRKRVDTAVETACSQNKIDEIIQSAVVSHKDKLSEAEDRLRVLEELNPKMGRFEWLIEDYTSTRDDSDVVHSPLFYSSLNGHLCDLSVLWFDRRKSRLGVRFTVGGDVNLGHGPFCMKVVIVCIGRDGVSQICELTDFSNRELDDEIAADGEEMTAGDEYFLTQPRLDEFVIDNTMRFICYLS